MGDEYGHGEFMEEIESYDKYRGSHENLRLWRECETQQFLEAVALFSLKQEAPASVDGGTFTNAQNFKTHKISSNKPSSPKELISHQRSVTSIMNN